ncbi:hypothetical protein HB852_13085 [Listeria grandensis]|uniref:Ig-like domain-containing protein n=1 Tax=Listeria grandensis TaxID=1494963 RepID=UPI0016265A06|nr:Ig-like domain-containing protein [Listeria grandensis]MBC1475547.1 hypothetical protein [Listeria grandensis]
MKIKSMIAGLSMAVGLVGISLNMTGLTVEATELPGVNTAGPLLAKEASKELAAYQTNQQVSLTGGVSLGSTKISGTTTKSGFEMGIQVYNPLTPNDVQQIRGIMPDDKGHWETDIRPLRVGDELTFFIYDKSVYDQRVDVAILTPAAIKKEDVAPVTTNSTQIVGKGGFAGATIRLTVFRGEGDEFYTFDTTTTVNADGSYKLDIPKQPAGCSLRFYQDVQLTPTQGSFKSEYTVLQVIQGIEEPKVSPVTYNSTSIQGQGKPGAVVRVKVSGTEIGIASVDAKGDFEVPIPKQKAGTRLFVTQEQDMGGIDISDPVVVIADQVTPEVTSELKDGMTSISGTASPGASVAIWIGDVEIATTVKADDVTGDWSATVPALVGGNVVQVRATLPSGEHKYSSRYGVNLLKPNNLRAIIIGDRVKVTGKGSPGASVHVTVEGILAGTTIVDNTGSFEVLILRQIEGEQLSITQTKNGLSSVAAETTVIRGLDKPSNINIVTTDSTKVTGKGTPNATISIKVNGSEIGTSRVDTNGAFDVAIPKQAAGTKLSISQLNGTDESEPVVITVINGQLAAPTISAYYLNVVYIRGEVPKGAVKISLVIDGEFVRIGMIGTDGKYSIYANDVPKLNEAGKKFEVVATDEYGQLSEVAEGEVKDLANPIVEPYRAGQAYVRGTTRVGTERIAVYDTAGVLLHNGQVGEDGTYRIYVTGLAALQTVGNKFIVKAFIAGVVSGQTTAEVLK